MTPRDDKPKNEKPSKEASEADGENERLGPFDGSGPFDIEADPVPHDRKRRHTMNLWPDMEIVVHKPTGMGISSSVSRGDFNTLCGIHRMLGRVCFSELVITRKVLYGQRGETDIPSLLAKLSDEELAERVVEIVTNLDRASLEAVYLMVHSYTGKDLFV